MNRINQKKNKNINTNNIKINISKNNSSSSNNNNSNDNNSHKRLLFPTVEENISIEMVTNIIDKDTSAETVKSHSVMVTIG